MENKKYNFKKIERIDDKEALASTIKKFLETENNTKIIEKEVIS